MFDLYFWPTPNGYKILQFLEETGLDCRAFPIDISKGEQFNPEFLKVSPNNKIPALVDHSPGNDGEAITIFESGAILLYLAEKTGRLIPENTAERAEVLQWLFWQVAGLGPIAGQVLHFLHYSDEEHPYSTNRYINETARLFGVLENQLRDKDYIAGEFSIADIANYPWAKIHERIGQSIEDYPNVKNWIERIAARPATVRAYNTGPKLAKSHQQAAA